MADGASRGDRARRAAAGAGRDAATCTTTRSRRGIRCGAARSATRAAKAAMKLIAKADVVLALGTRLGPFGTLPQYGIDYWPKNAKIIQVDADAKMLGLVKPISVGICGDAQAAARRSPRGSPARRSPATRTRMRASPTSRRRRPRGKPSSTAGRTRRTRGRSRSRRTRAHMHPRQMLRELERAMPDGRDGVDRHRQHLLGVELATCASTGRARCSRR